MWAALDPHQMLIAADNTGKSQAVRPHVAADFILPPHSTPQEATELVNAMRNMFDLRFVSSGQTANTVEVRGACSRSLEACARLLDTARQPAAAGHARCSRVTRSTTSSRATSASTFPTLSTCTTFRPRRSGGAGGQNIQHLINQLIASGGINQAGSTALSGLLAQLGGQGNSIFSQPLATFGGGLTFRG